MSETYVLGDWGTTRLRLYRMNGGAMTDRLDGPGTGSLPASAQTVLAERLETWLGEGPISEVILCGMAGAPGALVEAGYAPCPTNAAGWLGSLTCTKVAGVAVGVLPGLSCRAEGNVPEVMRGEETQVFGALTLQPELAEGRHLIVLPGTHSKWVELEEGKIRAFHTHPTGELFALLADRSTLTGPDTPGEGAFDDGFARGLQRRGEPFTSALFEARAARMLDRRSRDWSKGYLSGLLIGSEAAAQARAGASVVLIGDPALSALYERALAEVGCGSTRVDGDAAVIAGLELAREKNA